MCVTLAGTGSPFAVLVHGAIFDLAGMRGYQGIRGYQGRGYQGIRGYQVTRAAPGVGTPWCQENLLGSSSSSSSSSRGADVHATKSTY